jgi:hypothetical protein
MCFFSSIFSWASWIWEFSKLHFGIALVVVGVAGEGFDLVTKFFWKDWHKTNERIIEFFELFFWAMVVFGLILEMQDEAKSDNKVLALQQQIEQTKTNVANADPRNLQIDSIEGYVFVEVRTNGNLAADIKLLHIPKNFNAPREVDEEVAKNELVSFRFGKSADEPDGAEIGILGSVQAVSLVDKDSINDISKVRFDIKFSAKDFPTWFPSLKLSELKFVQFWLPNDEILTPVEVAGGEIHLKLNDHWPMTFLIPPQTNSYGRISSLETNNSFVPATYGLVTNLDKTLRK